LCWSLRGTGLGAAAARGVSRPLWAVRALPAEVARAQPSKSFAATLTVILAATFGVVEVRNVALAVMRLYADAEQAQRHSGSSLRKYVPLGHDSIGC